jgi:Plasma-membrane choline transporter
MESLNGLMIVSLAQINSRWYFTQKPQGGGPIMGDNPIRSALRISFIYHLGSIILGASIMAFVQLLKMLLESYKNRQNMR